MYVYTDVFLLISLFLAMLGHCCCSGFTPVLASRGYSAVLARGLLIALAPLVAERRLHSVVAAPGL